jgi:undecaprenyl-diphosphatase
MTDLHAAVLGFVQGISEWLPISSTAHLKIVPALLGWPDPGAAFSAVIQWGTVFAALVYFRRDIANILLGVRSNAPDPESARTDRRLLVPILVGTLPIVVVGLLFQNQIENQLRSPYVIGVSMIVFALLLGLAEVLHRARREMGSVTVLDGLLVGIGQTLALIPGASRSGTTITAALSVGLERATAARFSFLLSLPAVFGAGLYELKKALREGPHVHLIPGQNAAIQPIGARPLLIATVVAFFVGWASIDWFIKFLRKHPTYVFIVYRIMVGAALLALAAKGLIEG